MKILVINSNMSDGITKKIARVAEGLKNPDTMIDCVSARWGVATIEGNYDSVLGALATVEIVDKHKDDYDAFIIACYSDPGMFAAREITNKPVYGIAQASMLTACSFGHRFSILTPLQRFKPILENLVSSYRLDGMCASVRTVDMDVKQTFDDLDAANRIFADEAKRAIAEDGAEVICLAGAVFAGRDKAVTELSGAVCIDGFSSALKMAEGYHKLGYTSSKVSLFSTPIEKKRIYPDQL